MKDKLRQYESEDVRVTWSGTRCIHFQACVRGLGNVFDVAKKPWIQPAGANVEEVVDTVLRCPTGALHFQRLDGGAPETVPDRNAIHVSSDGPLYVRGDITLRSSDGTELLKDTRVALCRCGHSGNKPFCDGSHARVGFHDSGAIALSRMQQADAPAGLEITPLKNGPYQVRGTVQLYAAGGSARVEGSACKLCRCGNSEHKPFCDGSHRRVEWKEASDD